MWNRLTDRPGSAGIADLDVAYFDRFDLEGAGELALQARLDRHRGRTGPSLDGQEPGAGPSLVRREVRLPILPYPSIEAAIASWPTTATAIGVRLKDGELDVFAPFGLDDLFDMVVRPNKAQVTRPIYEAKTARWPSCWPELEIVPW